LGARCTPEGRADFGVFLPWDYFYDPIGKRTIWLTRRLMKLRRKAQFLRGEHRFYDDPERYQSRGLLQGRGRGVARDLHPQQLREDLDRRGR